MRSFDTEYKRLNPKQREAVDTVEGPVMVVAGPGTGKTQVLGMRVANILKKTHAKPANILCLTFSTSGSTAMRERLRELIGSDAYGVTVSTVHGFCDSIIARNAPVFAEWAAKKQITDIAKYQAMRDIIDAMGPSDLINPKNPYDRIAAILGRISDCKREGKTLADLKKVAAEYDEQMASKSKKGTKAHEKNLLAARKFRSFIDLFERYTAFLQETGAYDYDDMILTVLQVLKSEDWLLSGLQERYQYILVDEAQDLNGSQWAVIERLTTYDNVPNDPNFFVVGDDDQAIYRFQGANMEHMLRFHDHFPKAPVIVLTDNYRSTQPILDAAGKLIAKNEERLVGRMKGLTKDLKASTDKKGIEPFLLRSASDAAEPWLIADLIEERMKSGISPKEIAVLVQTNAELRPIYDVLRARDIPVVLYGKADLLSHPVVVQAVTILKCVDGRGDETLLQAMACDCFDCHPADLARLVASAREQKKPVLDLLLGLEQSELPYLRRDGLIKARDLLLDVRQKHASRTVLQTVESVLRESGISAMAPDLDPADLAVIEEFFRYTKQRCFDHPALTLKEYLRDLRWYDDEAFGQLRLTYQIPHLVSEGVQLLTAHQSKGLEFHTVLLASFRDGHWDQRRNPPALSLPDELLFGYDTSQKTFEKHQDERRVAYVAMTRAKRELIFLCPREFSVGERARAVSPSAFFAEAGTLPERDGALKEAEKSSLLLLHPKRKPDAELDAYLRERLKTFALSPTSLGRFLDDPEEFKRIDLLGQPEELSESSLLAMGYGSAVHWALKEWAAARQSKKELSSEDLLKAFEWHLTERNILTDKQRGALMHLGKEALPRYYEARLAGSQAFIHSVERDHRGELGDIPLKGKIDRIDRASELSADAIVMDYKTGRPQAPAEIRGGIEEGKISRGDAGRNFRQLVFYSLLLELSEPMLVPQAFCLEFIGERGEDPVRREFAVTASEKDDLKALIKAVWAKIVALDFTPL
jgi:DNA helicase II / ATP-dependent DNA helicase PcrA